MSGVSEAVERRLRSMMVPEARWAYWQDGAGPMFVYNTERIHTPRPDDPANGRFESAVYVPVKGGGEIRGWRQLKDASSLHHLRRDAKARAWKLYQEWREHGTVEGKVPR